MHIADRFDLPDGFAARPYRGPSDHATMAAILTDHGRREGSPELVTADHIDANYARLENCDPATEVFVIETVDGDPVAYGRSAYEDLDSGVRDLIVFAPTMTAHVGNGLFHALADGLETHLSGIAQRVDRARYHASARHHGPDRPATGEASWLEARGYEAGEWVASLARPHLDDIPERELPDGVEVRPVTESQLRTIVAAHLEAFRGEWDFHEPTERDYAWFLDDPNRDHTLWQVAWAGDDVVGQVKPFINHTENEERRYRRGYAEHNSTHRDWRGRGIAGGLLALSLATLRDRGMTEAALGVDTNNPGGAFQLYQSLGFEPQTYTAVYFRDAME